MSLVNFGHISLNTYISFIEVIDMKITCSRRTPTKEVLQHIYDVMNKNISNPKCFYTSEEMKQLKKDKSAIWL